MAKVTGLGGIFYKVADTAATQRWYLEHLGVGGEWGAMFPFKGDNPEGYALLSPFKAETDYFAPSDKEFMFNLMVDDLDGVLGRCAEHEVTPVKTFDPEANGRFAHIMDPEGRKILEAGSELGPRFAGMLPKQRPRAARIPVDGTSDGTERRVGSG